MRILIIGGTQFMGREVVRRLLQRGHDVTVLHRSGSHDLGAEVRSLQADRGDLDTVRRLLREHAFEAVFDIAYDWQKGTTAADVEAAARAAGDRLHRYVFMSSIAAYGGGTDHREEDPLAPDDHPNPYIQHKATAERALFRLHAGTGLPVTTIRPPFVHGPRQPFYREAFFWDRMLDGRPIILPDGGGTPCQWVYSLDVADTCVRALESPDAVGQAFNIGHEPGTQRSFVEALGRAAGVEPHLVPVSREKIFTAGGSPMMGNLYYGEYLDLPPITQIVEKAPRVLGVTPMTLDAALRETFTWYRTQPRRPVDYTFEDRLLSTV